MRQVHAPFLRWGFVILLAAGLVVTTRSLVNDPRTAVGMTFSVGLAVIVLALTWLLLRRHPALPQGSRWVPIGLGLAWGLACSGPAVFFNTAASKILDKVDLYWLDAAAYSPVNEETLKVVGVALICAGFVKLHRAIEAVPIGIAVGAGFTTGEDPHFIADGVIKDLDSDVIGAVSATVVRILTGPFGHSVYTGLAAFGVGVLVCRTGALRSVLGWWFLAFAVHTAGNLASTLAGIAPDDGVLWIIFGRVIVGWVLAVWLYLRSRKLGARPAERNHSL